MNEPSAIKVGQIWKELDPRSERFVRIVGNGSNIGHRRISIITVVHREDNWRPAPRSRITYCDERRFNGKRGGFALHEEPSQGARE